MKNQIYHVIEAAIRNQVIIQPLDEAVTEDDIRQAIRWVMRDNPDIFWFSHQYEYYSKEAVVRFQYTFSPERVVRIRESIDDVVKNDFCLDEVRRLSPREQVAYVYKWLVTYCSYNVNSAYNQTIYSVLVRRNSVCTGYARTAQYLFGLLGLESRLVFGRLHHDSEEGRHCWNMVRLEGEYYHFDACLADSSLESIVRNAGLQDLYQVDGINYNFLCVSTPEILLTRTIEDMDTLPESHQSLPREVVGRLAIVAIGQREDIKGCLLSHIGSSADVYLCSKDKNTVLKVFRPGHLRTVFKEYSCMQQTKGCPHVLQCNEGYTDISRHVIAIEQSTPIVDLLCSHYYKLTFNGLVSLVYHISVAWKECQSRGVLYRDIHICNIYRANDGTFKLGDMGSCTTDFNSREVVGNAWFMAPETFIDGVFTESSAVYVISMVMYFILNGLRPAFWKPGSAKEAMRRRMKADALDLPLVCRKMPIAVQESVSAFFCQSLAFVPSRRMTDINSLQRGLSDLLNALGADDYVIYEKGRYLDFDVDDHNTDYLQERWNYIFHDAWHRISMGEVLECLSRTESPNYCESAECEDTDKKKLCRSTEYEGASLSDKPVYTVGERDGNSESGESLLTGSLCVDEVENFASTMGSRFNLDSDSVTPCECPAFQGNENVSYIPKCIKNHYLTKDELSEMMNSLKKYQHDTHRQYGIEESRIKSELVQAEEEKAKCGFSFFSFLGIDKKKKKQQEKVESLRKILSEKKENHARFLAEIQSQINDCQHQMAAIEEQEQYTEVYSSVFAPAEVKRRSNLIVQVYLHLFEESENIKAMASETDRNAKRRDYNALDMKLKPGDKVDVAFSVHGETGLVCDRKSVVWNGSFRKCTFNYFVPEELDVEELRCELKYYVNGTLLGDSQFTTQIVAETPRELHTEVTSEKYHKIFISYAHLDFDKVKFMAAAYRAQGVDYFFDRDYLKGGDIYPKMIRDYIDTCDLFVLCWSSNAAQSEYVQLEKAQALPLAKNTDQKHGTLTIRPLSLRPRAALPDDMKDTYNFEKI